MRWIDLTPPDFRRAVSETGLCIVPVGSLERHGEHGYFGTDGANAEALATKAAELEPAVVFPTWWWGQVHEAACFEGAINFPPEMLITMMRQLLNQIAHNGFKKICILNAHGGNNAWLEFFDMSLLDEPRDYTLYIINTGSGLTEEEKNRINSVWQSESNHASESETSISMANLPGRVHLEYSIYKEPILPLERLKHLKDVYSGLWWYANYPENVTGSPSLSTQEKGQIVQEILSKAISRTLAAIKEDTVLPELQKEFLERCTRLGK